MSATIDPYRVDVPETVLEDLRERLARTRWPDQLEGTGWDYGADLDYVRDLCRYWEHEFDWRAVERRLNSFDQFVTEIDGERVHFIHARSSDPDALPLLMTHGWPGSVVEFLDVIEPLTETFHVVCPSIPGYAFSGPTRHTGVHVHAVADRFVELMDRLGYERYVAQGGDFGSEVTRWLGSRHAEHVVGIHLNMLIVGPPDRPDAYDGLTEAELAAMAEAAEFAKTGMGYLQLQSTKPQTLAYGLTDSPAGLAAWIVDKFHAWTQHDGDVEQALSRDQMLANITTYWVTGTANSASRLYYESTRDRGPVTELRTDHKVEVPTGCAIYPGEILRPPRKWVEEVCPNIVHWVEMPAGGHFAAFEQPELFVDDLKAFARTLS